MSKLKMSTLLVLITFSFLLSALTREGFTSSAFDTGTGGGGGPTGCIIETHYIPSFSKSRGTHSVSCGSCSGWIITEYPNPYKTGVLKYQQTTETFYAIVTECEQSGYPTDNCYGEGFTGINCGSSELPEGATSTDTWGNTDTSP